MKTKNGFVSNSSSSSFVVLLPENFLKTIDEEKISDNYIIYNSGDDKFPVDDFRRLLTNFVEEGYMYNEEIYEYDEYDYGFVDILTDFLSPYIIAKLDTSSDGGQFVVADRKKIEKLI
jgi:hypothetical protein